ncbi:MAG: hypothetical protein IJ149_04835 [Oscillospiraceae bacterium]|nr:hypothetical protein [Oscillospiraceae bacterium]
MILELIRKIVYPHTYSEEAYKKWLKSKGVSIGTHTKIYSPNHTQIDVMAPYMIKIGDYCKITRDVQIIAHDYSRSVFRRCTEEGLYMGGRSPVTIGDNVFIGIKAIILMGTVIGNNSIVGAGAVVKGKFPDGVVIPGNPAKVMCTIDEYYEKCRRRWVSEAKDCVKEFKQNAGRYPERNEISGFAWMFTPHTEEMIKLHPELVQLQGDNSEEVIESFLSSKPIYSSYEEFINDCECNGE